MSNIAYLGTGLLGSGLAEAAAKRGDKVTVWNRTIDKARALERFGARVAQTPADAVRGVERVHLVLKDDAVVEDVIAAMRPGLDPKAIVVDHTTTLPALTAARATRLNAEGVRYIHCPVFIGPAAARQGKGAILAAGPRAIFDEIRDALEAMADRVEYFGERPDLAAVFKICGNAVIIGVSGISADVLAVSGGAGVSPDEAMRVFEFLDVGAMLAGRTKNMIAQNFAPSFELTMARKDVGLMIKTAEPRPLAMLTGIAARMDALIADGHGADDVAVLGIAPGNG